MATINYLLYKRAIIINKLIYKKLNYKMLCNYGKYAIYCADPTLLQLNSKCTVLTRKYCAAPKSSEDTEDENRVFTIPNLLTSTRIAITPLISYYLLNDAHSYATMLFLFAGVTDYLDGYIARNFPNQKSYIGSIIDPLADKLLIGTLSITLAFCNLMPFELMYLFILRDSLLILSSLIVRYKIIDKPVTLSKYLNVTKYANVKIEALFLSKLNTFLQIALIGLSIPSQLFEYNDHLFMKLLQYSTALTTIVSGLQYIYKGGSFKVIKK